MSSLVLAQEIDFHADVFVEDRARAERVPVRRGRFLMWVQECGDAVALVATARGQARVRWSMIVGVDSPRGLLKS